jgi:Family of unknown function (DUF5372)
LVTITHPHHPLCGQKVPVVGIRRGTHPDLIIRLPDGSHAAVAMNATDYEAASATPVSSAPDPPLLALDGLRQIVQFLERLRHEGRFPAPTS